jgi:hypothetical protein
MVSCVHLAARCSASVILSPQAKNLVFAANERDIAPRSFVPQDDTIMAANQVDLSRIDLDGGQ